MSTRGKDAWRDCIMMITDELKKELLDTASKAMENARVGRTGFHVGAAVLTRSGRIYSGCNVELTNALYSICAERTALVKAISEGAADADILAIAVTSDSDDITTPCCFCRQFMMDINPEMLVIAADRTLDKVQTFTVEELTPLLLC